MDAMPLSVSWTENWTCFGEPVITVSVQVGSTVSKTGTRSIATSQRNSSAPGPAGETNCTVVVATPEGMVIGMLSVSQPLESSELSRVLFWVGLLVIVI